MKGVYILFNSFIREMNVIEFADFSEINCYISNNRRRDIFNMNVPKHKDLVIRFDSSSDRKSFIDLLKQTAQEKF